MSFPKYTANEIKRPEHNKNDYMLSNSLRSSMRQWIPGLLKKAFILLLKTIIACVYFYLVMPRDTLYQKVIKVYNHSK